MNSISTLTLAGALTLLLSTFASPAAAQAQLANDWVATAAEYRAATRMAYRAASAALPGLIADASHSAIPYQSDAEDLPPAIILDIDQTVVDGSDFQLGYEPPFTAQKFDDWNDEHDALPVHGAAEFIALAREHGVRVIFVTNRRCTARGDDPCPQKPITVADLAQSGVPADPEDVTLAGEREGWESEKQTRRDHFAETHRIIMLFGDDLGDFIPCVRARPSGPCSEAGTIANRFSKTDAHSAYWGTSWYLLPNPMYGSWTTVD